MFATYVSGSAMHARTLVVELVSDVVYGRVK